jgi:lipopolysaccharide export system protein LptA
MFYDGKIDIAEAKNNVVLIDKETHLYTNAIKYDIKNQVAHYDNKGKIVNNKDTLTSIIGVYYVDQNLFHFKDSVKIVNPDYVMTSDTMNYNTETETVFFTGPSEVNGDSIYMYCERGWYETKSKISSIWKNAFIDNKKNTLRGDSLFYDDSLGFGQAFRNVVIEDTTNSVFVMGNYAQYNKIPEKIFATDSAVFLHVAKDDSLFIHGDTLRSITIRQDSLSFRLVKSYYNCRIFSNSVQAKCDSLTMSFQDTIVRLYHEPVMWSEENQLTADSMALFITNEQADKLVLYRSAFVTSQIDTLRYNQVKGSSLTAYFKDNEIYKIDVIGNGESIYYLLDGEELAGLNKSKSGNIQIFVEKGKVTDVYENQSPQGVIDPPDPESQNEPRLDGFMWLNELRPKDKNDIFRKD